MQLNVRHQNALELVEGNFNLQGAEVRFRFYYEVLQKVV